MCGKDFLISIPNLLLMGSPPHVRERLHVRLHLGIAYRITPACAGKTSIIAYTPPPYRDHPRMCGKDCLEEMKPGGSGGSPPHVRERQRRRLGHEQKDGITPACAGKTSSAMQMGALLRDHPRMCGKDLSLFFYTVFDGGSPPHVRERQ